MAATNGMLDPDDSIILLIDHQSGFLIPYAMYLYPTYAIM